MSRVSEFFKVPISHVENHCPKPVNRTLKSLLFSSKPIDEKELEINKEIEVLKNELFLLINYLVIKLNQ
jgi:hypothetical protein